MEGMALVQLLVGVGSALEFEAEAEADLGFVLAQQECC
jgi:hypothetical protein